MRFDTNLYEERQRWTQNVQLNEEANPLIGQSFTIEGATYTIQANDVKHANRINKKAGKTITSSGAQAIRRQSHDAMRAIQKANGPYSKIWSALNKGNRALRILGKASGPASVVGEFVAGGIAVQNQVAKQADEYAKDVVDGVSNWTGPGGLIGQIHQR